MIEKGVSCDVSPLTLTLSPQGRGDIYEFPTLFPEGERNNYAPLSH
jgi:hypothetical protein